MSLKFIYGKIGTGKTTYCFQTIKTLLNTNQKIYMITPEQFSYAAEKNLMEVIDQKAVMNAEVITFERMAYRLLNEIGKKEYPHITNCGKAMLIAYLMEKEKNNLNYLGKTDKNIELMVRMITELKKNNITIEFLKEKMDTITEESVKMKLKDISLLYHDFQEIITNHYLDDDDLLTLIKDQVTKSSMFQDAYVLIDEFSGFTKQEYDIIGQIAKKAKQVYITICTDSLENALSDETDIFHANKNTYLKLKKIAIDNHIIIENPIQLKTVYRYQNEELQYLAENLCQTNLSSYPKKCEAVQLFLAHNAYSEIEYVANNIIELVREEKFQYRDIAIITKETQEYASLIRAIFAKYQIPVFIDEKKDLNQNILIQYILAILTIFAKNWSQEAVLSYLKTGFLSEISQEEQYAFENYCKKYGITRFKKFSQEWVMANQENLENLNNIRKKIIEPLIKLKEEFDQNKTVKEISKVLYTFLENNHISNLLLEKIKRLQNTNEIERASLYQASWDLFMDLLDELVCTLGEEKVSFEQYIYFLKSGLNQSSLGKIPATLDQIIVGDVDRSRSSKKKIIFVIGLNDGKFPSVHKNEGFINDDERIYLKEKGIELAKTTKEQAYDESFNIYKALGVAEEKLYLSYIASDSEGKGLRKSIYINRIKKIFPQLIENSDMIQKQIYISSKEVTFELLLVNLRKFLNGDEIQPIWWELYAFYQQDNLYAKKLEQAMLGMDYTNLPEPLNQENLKKLYGNQLKTSVSQLESYRRCPFSYYLKYGLRLSDRTEFKLERVDTGTFMHDMIHEFFAILQEQKKAVKELTDEEIEKIVEEIIHEKLSLKQNYIFNSVPQYVVLTKRLKKVITTAIKYIIETLKFSDFQVLGTEVEFGEGKQYEPIEIELENHKKVEMIGKIDRIDIAENEKGKYIRIIDYKSSVKNIDLNEVVAGIQIQLLTYLDAVSKKENADLAGILYFNLIEPVIKLKNKHLSEAEIEQEIRNRFRMNGLILGDVEVIKMMDHHLTTGSSNIIPAYIDKDGNLSKTRSSLLEKTDFILLQNKVEKTIQKIAEEIMSGEISQKPMYSLKNKYTACEFCSYQAVCGFDRKLSHHGYQYIPNLKKEEILNSLRETT